MENSSSRTQFIKRLVEFAESANSDFLLDCQYYTVKLAYYPPCHSKYNPVERVWGIYENHIVNLTKELCKTGVKAGEKAMRKYNEFVERMLSLEKWFLTISPGYLG